MHLIFQMVKKFEYFSVYFFFLYITTTWTVLPKKKKLFERYMIYVKEVKMVRVTSFFFFFW